MTLLFGNYKVFNSLIKKMAKPFMGSKVDKVVAIEASGFIFGTGVANELKAGLCLIRKPSKLAWDTKKTKFTDYSKVKKEFEIASDAIEPTENILIVDDWSETGAQLKAAIFLVEQARGNIVGISCVHIDDRVKNDAFLSRYKLHSAISY